MVTNAYLADLTGQLDAYGVENDFYAIYKTGQVIEFGEPIFQSSITIVNQNDRTIQYVSPADWGVEATDIDETSQAKAKVTDNTFNSPLVKSITWNGVVSEAFVVSLGYQKLYPVASKFYLGDDGTIELTPALIYDMLERLNNFDSILSGSSLAVVPRPINPKLLELDVNKENASENTITHEQHSVDTYNNIALVQPVHGDFFRDSLTVRDAGTGDLMVEGTDYVVRSLNQSFTRQTTNNSGIYRHVHITRQMKGDIIVSYHAVGGDVSVDAVSQITELLNNISNYVGQRNFLTSSALTRSIPYISLINKIQAMEGQLRTLATTGSPNYADATNGTSQKRRFNSDDANLHWWNIASLYTVSGSSQIFTADRFKFRLQIPEFNYMADIIVSLDLDLDYNKFNVKAVNVLHNVGYEFFSDVASANAATICYPQLRVIWNRNTTLNTNDSGVHLQLGLNVPGTIATVAIEDMSGIESAWILTPAAATQPETHHDTAVTLPNDVYTWTTIGASSHSLQVHIPTEDPYLAWEGSKALNTFDHDVAVVTRLPSHFRVEDIKEIEMVVQSGSTDYAYFIRIPTLSKADNTVTGRGNISRSGVSATDDIRVTIQNSSGVISAFIGPESGNVLPNAFSTHLVKYITCHI